jgi:hypothetical protein
VDAAGETRAGATDRRGYMYARRKIEVTKCVVESAGLKDSPTTLAPKNLSPYVA